MHIEASTLDVRLHCRHRAVWRKPGAGRQWEQVTAEVRALLQEWQDTSKARLDPGRRDVQFVSGDLVLLDIDRIPNPSWGLL